MSTIGDLVDRTFRTYLEPPDFQPPASRLAAPILAGASTLTLTGFEVPEDESLMRAGVVLEIASELFIVTAYDDQTLTCTLDTEEKMGTTPADHPAGARVKLAPPVARLSLFQAIADNIMGLFPSVYTVRNVNLAVIGGIYAPIEDDLAAEIIEVSTGNMGGADSGLEGTIADYHHQVGGRTVVLSHVAGEVWVRYRRRFADVTSEDDTFEDIGLEERWANIVMLGACADVIVGRDLPESHVEWVGQVLKAENIRVGTRLSLAGALRQYQAILLEKARKEMGAEYRPGIRVRRAASSIW